MTDGIIQKVFRKYYSGGFQVDIDDVDVMVIPASTLEDFAKELIQEISKLRVKPCELYCGFCEAQNANIQEIIGETKK